MSNTSTPTATPRPRSRCRLGRIARTVALAVGGIVLVIMIICSAILWYLSPTRLTPIVEHIASTRLNADVSIGRVELTLWSTFPRMRVEVTDMCVVSRSLAALSAKERAALPSGADSLMSVGYFSGHIDLLELPSGHMALSDVEVDRPRINLLQVNDSVSNFDIFPTTGDTSSKVPDITVERFVITNAEPLTYRSMVDDVDIAVDLRTVRLDGDKMPTYTLQLHTNLHIPLLRDYAWQRTKFNIDGSFAWSAHTPDRIGIKGLDIAIDDLQFTVDADVTLAQQLTLNSLYAAMPDIDVSSLLSHAPMPLQFALKGLDTDMHMSAYVSLTRPYTFGESLTPPWLDADISIPRCHLRYRDLLLDDIVASIGMSLRGERITSLNSLTLKGNIDLGHLRYASADSTSVVDIPGIHIAWCNARAREGDARSDTLMWMHTLADSLSFSGIGHRTDIAGLIADLTLGTTLMQPDSLAVIPLAATLHADSAGYIKGDLQLRFDSIGGTAMAEFARQGRGLTDMSADLRVGCFDVSATSVAAELRHNHLTVSDDLHNHRWLDGLSAALTTDEADLYITRMNVRSDLSHIALRMQGDTISVDNLDYRLAHSDLALSGYVSDLIRHDAATPIRIELNVVSDTLDIDGIRHSFCHHSHPDDLYREARLWLDNEARAFVYDVQPDSLTGPLLLPRSFDALLRVKAANVLYSRLPLHDVDAYLLITDGTANIYDLHATSEAGDIDMSAYYDGATPDSLSFGLAMTLSDFTISHIKDVVPALDAILPVLANFSGTIDSQIAVTSRLTPDMYVDRPSLRAAFSFDGDSLVIIDEHAFHDIAESLLFKHRERNVIDRLSTQFVVADETLTTYPFMLDIDRYRLGVYGHNTFDLDLDYHVAVLKSPIPFHFGVNVTGRPKHLHIHFGGPKYDADTVAQRDAEVKAIRTAMMQAVAERFVERLKASRLLLDNRLIINNKIIHK